MFIPVLSSSEVCLVCGLEFWLARVEEVGEDAADGLEDVAGGDAVLVLDVPLPQQPHPLLHAEGLETLHQSGVILSMLVFMSEQQKAQNASSI